MQMLAHITMNEVALAIAIFMLGVAAGGFLACRILIGYFRNTR